jgi:hypothetical protein
MPQRNRTNEWEFQGEVLKWLNEELQRRPGMRLEKATQEPSKVTRGRDDLVVWWNRSADRAFLTFSLKTPATPITDPDLLSDADKKAKRWGATFSAIWNMQAAELYAIPETRKATPADRLHIWGPDSSVKTVNDWLRPEIAAGLRTRAIEILDLAWGTHVSASQRAITIEAHVFVERLSQRLSELRAYLKPALDARVRSDRSVRQQISALAAAQGFIGFVEDINDAVVGQYAYRLIGQVLFYLALRRKQPLPPLELSGTSNIPEALRPYWDNVRRFDYEALFQPNELDDLVPVPSSAQAIIRALISDLGGYDWNRLKDDVLGSVFENLLPKHEQLLLVSCNRNNCNK